MYCNCLHLLKLQSFFYEKKKNQNFCICFCFHINETIIEFGYFWHQFVINYQTFLSILFMYLSVGKRGFPLKNHSYSGSGYPATKAVNLAAMPLNTISSPIFLRNSGASDLPFSMNSTISNCPLVDPDPSLLLAKHS